MVFSLEKIKIRNMVVTLRNVASSTSLNWKMKHFYESCMNLDNIETDEGKPLKKIISTGLGKWDEKVRLFLTVYFKRRAPLPQAAGTY